MQRPLNLCDSCAHLRKPKRWYEARDGIPSCNAFEDGIPVQIWNGGDHRQPVSGDEGVQYLPRPGGEDLLAAYLDQKESGSDVASALGD